MNIINITKREIANWRNKFDQNTTEHQTGKRHVKRAPKFYF